MRTYDDKMFIETFEHQYTWLNGFMRNVRRYGKKAALLDPADITLKLISGCLSMSYQI